MAQRSLSLLTSGLTLGLSLLLGCAPEEEGTPVVGRPKNATPTPVAVQKNDEQLKGGIKDTADTNGIAGTPTNPPDPEPEALPTWKPSPPPSLAPVIVAPSQDPTGEQTEGTTDPSADPGDVEEAV